MNAAETAIYAVRVRLNSVLYSNLCFNAQINCLCVAKIADQATKFCKLVVFICDRTCVQQYVYSHVFCIMLIR